MDDKSGLKGKVAFVTGGASGIGAEICRTLCTAGSKVAVADFNRDGAETMAQELRDAGCEALAVGLDVSDAASTHRAVADVVAHFGTLQLAVNNAGIVVPRRPLAEVAPEEWERSLAVNLTGVFNSMHAEIPALLAAGGGSIVNISSICGTIGVAGTSAYTSAKHGVVGLTKTAALDYGASGIRVNAVAPGYVETPILAERTAAEKADYATRHALGRMARPQEIADAVAWLLSDRASFVTGALHLIDGGYTAR